MILENHWRIQEGALPVRAPPTGSISFIFAYIFAKKCMRRRLAPPQWVGAPLTGNPGSATENVQLEQGQSPKV